ncbi:hypothetical protein [uncultured Legionella sp.]|uniref:hypothetical protein n=1 Tax=uncultured Legionella sp. TaxID=210934 RepID=UPI002604C1C6|nr:hypothetical protein [uncultured Legionella sp.]
MFGRVCQFYMAKGIKRNINIGRMLAETKPETLKEELEKELKTDGWYIVQERLLHEASALENFIWEEKQIKKQIDELFLLPALKRAKQGYSVKGFFWQQTQQSLNELNIQEQLKEINESIDWLNTRQKIIKDLEASYAPIETFRF